MTPLSLSRTINFYYAREREREHFFSCTVIEINKENWSSAKTTLWPENLAKRILQLAVSDEKIEKRESETRVARIGWHRERECGPSFTKTFILVTRHRRRRRRRIPHNQEDSQASSQTQVAREWCTPLRQRHIETQASSAPTELWVFFVLVD